ncbi:1-phosphatidylinositol phosphodiesterase [Ceratocystis platani]|uniref:1-phosphatidylinositol phosphodiesterase n=1 Tax=Ceratocystis fimbriata f. sp. platani TaxID=88771 RepID=A0A0F8D7R3_CERFI|nr:1-phosphatidylinositol phosphodiesterase [Ceratocystis platani]
MRCSLFTVLASLAFSHAGIFKDIEDKWSFDLDDSDQSEWMDTIGDEVALTALSIPGTHNSVTDMSGVSRTQNIPLDEQLIAGIRYIDITCWYTHDDIMIYNGRTATGSNLKSVLITLYQFLYNHPSEAIILRIHQGGGILGSSRAFLRSMEGYFGSDSEFGQHHQEYIYSEYTVEDGIPTLGQVRGKVLILRDFKSSSPASYGIPWSSDTVSSYKPGFTVSTLLLNRKWNAIKSHLGRGRSQDFNKLRITYTTPSVGVKVKPIDFAVENQGRVGMNGLLGDYLSLKKGNFFGVVVMDFPGYRLIDEILKLNKDYQDSELDDSSSYSSDATTVEDFDFDEVHGGETHPAEASGDDVDEVGGDGVDEVGGDERKVEPMI